MPVRIETSCEERSDGTTGIRVRVDGRLNRLDVQELVRVISELEPPVTLDFSELQGVERDAIGIVRPLLEIVMEVDAISPFLELLLNYSPNKQVKDSAD